MSRIGKKPVAIPAGVTASIGDGTLSVKGPKGELTMPMSDLISYEIHLLPAGSTIHIIAKKNAIETRAWS